MAALLTHVRLLSSNLESRALYLQFSMTPRLTNLLRQIFALALAKFCLLVLKDDIGAKTNELK